MLDTSSIGILKKSFVKPPVPASTIQLIVSNNNDGHGSIIAGLKYYLKRKITNRANTKQYRVATFEMVWIYGENGE